MEITTLLKRSTFRVLALVLLTGLILKSEHLYAQLPECEPGVPFFNIDLSSDPDSIYTTPEIVRNDQCCSGLNNRNYVSFNVLLHPSVAMVEIGIAPGYADPSGAGFYNIISGGVCGPDIPGGSSTCLTGSGPHQLVYHKPGSNRVKYYLKQTPEPIFPQDDTVRVGCSIPLPIFGLDTITITSINSSTGNTTPGAYNSLLSCTNCPNPVFTPGIATPTWIDYKICGSPQASACGTFTSCDTVRVFTYPQLTVSISPDPASFCANGNGVLLTATASGGLPPYTYTWKNSSNVVVGNGPTYTASSQGTYTVKANDQLSSSTCHGAYKSIAVTEANQPIVNAGPDDTICATSPTIYLQGSVQYASGGIWSGGTGTFNPNNTTLMASYTPSAAEINAGMVTLTLTSTNAGGGCADTSDQVTFIISDTIEVTATSTEIICYGGTSTLNLSATGGTPPYNYYWSNGDFTASTSVLAGTYSAMVMDATGCVGAVNITVSEPPPLQLNFTTTNVSVDSLCDGTATVSISGGAGPYVIAWANGDMTLTADSLCYGVTTITVTDSLGCVITGSVVINKPSCSAFDVTATTTNLLCFGDSNGTATAIVSGGIAPYTYSWNTTPAQTTATATGLSAGTYTVTVTDSLGCMDLVSVNITQPTVLSNTMLHTDATTIGGSDGTATVNVSGGTPAYTYTWNTVPPQFTQTATGLSANTYEVQVLDQNNCGLTDSVQINQPPCNNFLLAVTTTHVECEGESNGTASLLIAHGTPPYTIVWSSGQNNVTSVSGLAAGTYTVTVTDSTNCSSFQSFTITEPGPLSAGLAPTNVTCWGAADGTIELTVSGGTFPYTFQWYLGPTPIATHEDLADLAPGTYSVMVTDSNGCTTSESVGISQPSQITLQSGYTDVSCAGAADGTISIFTSGGTPPYTWTWTGPGSFSATTEDLTGLSAGLYELNVMDANGCQATVRQIYINQPDSVEIMSVDIPCPSPGNTTVIVEVDSIEGGAEGNYQVSFDNGLTFQAYGDYTASLSIGASYMLVARDSNGCLSIPFPITIDSAVMIDSVIFSSCVLPGSATVQVNVYPSGGDGGPYEVSSDGGATFGLAGNYILTLNVGASYSIVVRDTSGCLSLPTNITVPDPLIATATASAEVSCLGESDGSISLTVIGGVTPYSFAWTGPNSYSSMLEDPSGLEAGQYSVIVTDSIGCMAYDTVIITTIPDTTPPTITCPPNIMVDNDSGVCGAQINYNPPVGTDNCPGVSTVMIQGLATGSVFPIGVTTVVYVVTDTVGNTDTCSFTVTVNDTTNPVFSGCPSNIIMSDDGVNCGNTVTWTPPTVTDNCGTPSSITVTASHTPGSTFPVGTTTVTYTAVDTNGNTSICTFTVTINDTTAPVITNCPGNINAYSDTLTCGVSVNWTIPSATDNCGIASSTASHVPGDFFPVGTTTVTYTYTDTAGNISTCTFDVTVTDTIDPVILNCPANMVVSNDSGVCGAYVSWTAPTATDNCGSVSITSNYNPGDFFPVGTHTIIYTVNDTNGNSDSCSFTITVNDTAAPVVNFCPPNITAYSTSAMCGNYVTWNVPSATDNCGTVTTTNNFNSGDFFQVGTTTVTYTFTDSAGNFSVCTFDVTVIDTISPVISGCPSDIMMSDDGINCSNVVTWTPPTVTDNCGTTASITFTSSHSPGSTFPVGTTTVTYTATDTNGNTTTCTFNVTISDTTSPAISNCPGNINAYSDALVCGANVTWTVPTATDNCGIASSTATHASGDFFPVGTTTVTYTFTDSAGNTSICTFDVTVTDTISPVIVNCPSNITVSNSGSACGANVSWTAPTASDNCGAVSISSTHNPGTFFPVGTHTVIYTVNDLHGNTSTCTFTITVNDTTSPMISNCPNNITIYSSSTMCGNTATWNVPTATDNCGVVTSSSTYSSGDFFPVGTTTVVYTFTDTSGNSSLCTFTVTVIDTISPVFSGCPSNITVSNDGPNCSNTVTWTPPTVTDNCGTTASISLTSTHTPGSTFPVGTTTVTYSATDSSGNVKTCSFTVTVNDTTSPVVSNCPSDINAVSVGTQCGANVTWTVPTAMDNCGGVTTSSTHTSGGFFPVGTTAVSYTFTDAAGNSSVCTFNVIVTDTVSPVLVNCPTNITVSNSGSACGANVSWTAPTATDNCGTTTITSTNNPGTFFSVGTHVVTYTATDAYGNTSTCSFTLTVNDTTSPIVINCPQNITVSSTAGLCGANATWSVPTAQDNCGPLTSVSTHTSGSFFPVGTTAVTYTFSDTSGNSATCTFNVTVIDNTSPVIAGCPSNITIGNDPGQCGAIATWTAPSATDDCGTATMTSTHTSGAFFNTGTTQVTYTFTDAAGNSVTCSFNVTVTDTEAPVVANCPSNITASNDAGQCGAAVSWTVPTATDNCSAVTTTSTHASGATFTTGTTTVTYTFTDADGNSSTCSFNVTVNDTELPVITCPSNIAQCNSTVTYTAPTATDNCGVASVTLISGLGSGSTFPVGTSTEIYEVTDVNGNTSTCQFTVTIHPAPVISLVATDVSCNGAADGSIDATMTTGAAPFTYSWSNGATTQDINSLAPGSYTLTVIDNNGCSATASASITEPSDLVITSVNTNLNCAGINDGEIDVTVSGGTSPYTYAWDNGATTQDLTALAGGTYSLTVTDDNGCTEQISVTITEPDPLSVTATSSPSTCQAPNGTLDITVTGGTLPYSYSWSNGATSQDLINVAAGTYTVMITDANGCIVSYTDSVESISDVQFTATIKDVLCFGDENGSINIHPASPDYTYSWSNGATTEDLSGLGAGTYTVTVTDTNMCQLSATYTINESNQLEATLFSPVYTFNTNISTFNGNDGSIQTTVTGGTPPYSYAWSNGMTTKDISGLTAGTYGVVVTDANGCNTFAQIVLTEPIPLEFPTGFSPNGDGKNDFFVVKGVENYPRNEMIVYNRWGNAVYRKGGYANEWNGLNDSGKELPEGTYFILFKVNSDEYLYSGYVDLRRK